MAEQRKPQSLEERAPEEREGMRSGVEEDQFADALEKVDPSDLGEQSSETLPEREEMALINSNIAAPLNAAIAANILSDGSVAYANAEQNVDIDQST